MQVLPASYSKMSTRLRFSLQRSHRAWFSQFAGMSIYSAGMPPKDESSDQGPGQAVQDLETGDRPKLTHRPATGTPRPRPPAVSEHGWWLAARCARPRCHGGGAWRRNLLNGRLVERWFGDRRIRDALWHQDLFERVDVNPCVDDTVTRLCAYAFVRTYLRT